MPKTLPYRSPAPSRQFPVEILIPVAFLSTIGLFWLNLYYFRYDTLGDTPGWSFGQVHWRNSGGYWILPWPAVAAPFLYWLGSSCYRYLSPQLTQRIDQTR